MIEATIEEYNRATCTPHATKRIMTTTHVTDVIWSICGREIAWKTQIEGMVNTQTTYMVATEFKTKT
jgi:hypothetical protein